MEKQSLPTSSAHRAEGGMGSQGFTLPPIRTMADDLADVQQSGTTPPPLPIVISAPPKQVSPAPVASGKSIALPGQTVRPRNHRWIWILLIVVILGGAGGLTWMLLPRTTGTVADHVPEEALAFWSIRRGTSALETSVLPRFTGMLDIAPEALGTSWTEVASVLLPGASPSQPVPVLLVLGPESDVVIPGESAVFVQQFAPNVIALLPAAEQGRLTGLSGRGLGADPAFRRLLGTVSPAAPSYLYLREGSATALLQSFTLLPTVPLHGAALFALEPSSSGQGNGDMVITGTQTLPYASTESDGSSAWEELLTVIPAGAQSVSARSAIGTDIDALRIEQSASPVFQEFFRLFTSSGESVASLRTLLRGPYLAGTLPTETLGVRDGFLVFSLTPGASREQVTSAFRLLEGPLQKLDVALTGRSFPDAVFTETTYADQPVRYANFGSPDRAVDYAITEQFVLLATSRGSMRQLIDTLRTPAEHPPLLQDPTLSSWTSFFADSAWQYLRSGSGMEEVPTAWRALLESIDRIVLQRLNASEMQGVLRLHAVSTTPVVSPLPSPSPSPSLAPEAPTATPVL